MITKIFCSCGQPIEVNGNVGQEFNFPSCNNRLTLSPSTPIRIPKTPKSFKEIIHIISLIGFIGWTILCAWGVVIGIFNIALSEQITPTITSNDQLSQTAGTLGFIIGMGMWFGIWLDGAVPTFMVWIMTRNNYNETNINSNVH